MNLIANKEATHPQLR